MVQLSSRFVVLKEKLSDFLLFLEMECIVCSTQRTVCPPPPHTSSQNACTELILLSLVVCLSLLAVGYWLATKLSVVQNTGYRRGGAWVIIW